MNTLMKVILTGAILSASASVVAISKNDTGITKVLAETAEYFMEQYPEMRKESEYFNVQLVEDFAFKATESTSIQNQKDALAYLELFTKELKSRCDEKTTDQRVCDRLVHLKSAELMLRQLTAEKLE
ncbi:TPA: hypothetical protein RUZ39_000744 [Vibrio cholerae]|nr:hypothetical protein [Vibrio cholerae]